MDELKQRIDSRLERIANALILNACNLDNPGLMHGKTGVSIFFYYLSRIKNNPLYEEVADSLIDDVIDSISYSSSLNFKNGLMGIGWGIAHLVTNGFIKGDINEILADFDSRIYNGRNSILFDNSDDALNELAGLMLFLIFRIKSFSNNDKYKFSILYKDALIKCVHELENKTRDIERLITEPDKFEITWNYPIYIYLLKEVYKLDLLNNKTINLFKYFIEPISNGYRPTRHINRCQLKLSLHQAKEILSLTGHNKIIDCMDITKTDIEKLEFGNDNLTIQDGLSGMAIVYSIAFNCFGGKVCAENVKCLLETIYSVEFEKKEFAGFLITDRGLGKLGVLDGLAGIGMASMFLNN